MKYKRFLESIQVCRRRLNLAEFLKDLVFSLGTSACVGILFQTVAFVLPFYYANLYTALAMLLAVATALIASYRKRYSMRQAALFMDSFGFDERIVTAYENLDKEGDMVKIQREDAIKRLDSGKERIRIPLMPSTKKMVCAGGLLVLMIGMALMPSEVKDRAKELHQVKEDAREKEKEIEEVIEEIEEFAQEELTQEQLAALQEMMESLESSRAEYQQANSSEMLNTANEKLNYKYENMSSQLSELAQSLQNGASASMADAEAMQAMAEKLQEMSGNPSKASQSLASNQGQNGQNGGQNSGGNDNSGQNGSQDGNNGSGNSQSGQNGGQGSQSGGNGGQGNGNGQNGQGDGQGSGNGSGSGRGEGSSSASHDYVSIPNEIIDSGNLTGNAGNHDNSEYFRAPNGLSWEGTHVSHEAVIGNYEQNAYEGIAAGKYPSGMEDVIKEYFSSFN